jgi:hypothetical protein
VADTPTDPVIIPPPPPAPAPAVSPTGQAIIPPIVAKYAAPVVAIAGALALAPEAGITLPAIVLTVAKLVVLLGTVLGIVSPGARKAAA